MLSYQNGTVTFGHSSLNYTSNDVWVQIQRNTFTNWLNEKLQSRGVHIHDLRTDFRDGVNMVALVEVLTGKRIKNAFRQPSNQYEMLENVNLAIQAISRDGVRMVNIGSHDVVEGNLKLVLALVWQLILRYQVGHSAVQHRQWILLWLRGVIPECPVNNFTTDWNDGLALHALLEFCKPGIFRDWRRLDRTDRLNNCRNAMKLARQHFGIPLILRPEDLASPELDELSAITYLSYFLRVGGPGYTATLERLQHRVPTVPLSNFTTDWHDGRALCELIRHSGGALTEIHGSPRDVLFQAMETGRRMGVEPLLTPEEIVAETQEHLGIMAYTAQFLSFSPVIPYQYQTSYLPPKQYATHQETMQRDYVQKVKQYATHQEPMQRDFVQKVKVLMVDEETNSQHTSTLTSASMSPSYHLVGEEMHRLPANVELPPSSTYKLDTYSVGVIIDAKMSRPFDPEKLRVEAEAPSGRVIKINGNGQYTAQFTSTEIGTWHVALYYDNKRIDGCPIDVCDPSQVRVLDLRGGHVSKQQTFKVDCSKAGNGELGVDITHKGRHVPTHVHNAMSGVHKVTYTPHDPGPYEINVHFNRAEVRDSDFHSSDPEERQRKALFCTVITEEYGYVKIKTSCDWEIDYMTGGAFICHVTDSSSDIQVYGMQDGTICSAPELIADCTKVGDGGTLEAEVTHNGKRFPARVTLDKPGVYRISFRPRGPGVYKIWITYDGIPVKGSPFIQEIDELRAPTALGDGLKHARVGRPAQFTVDPHGFPGPLSVKVQGPGRDEVPINVTTDKDGVYNVQYVPREIGPHLIHISVDNKPAEGSPFNPYVVDPTRVRVSGGWRPLVDDTGVIPLVVGKEKHIPFDASEAGPGELTAEVHDSKGKVPVAIDTRGDGRNTVIFTPREEGKHYIDVFWCGFPLDNSPFKGFAVREPEDSGIRLVEIPLHTRPVPSDTSSSTKETPPHREPTLITIRPVESAPRVPLKVILSGRGLVEAQVDKEAEFKIDGTEAGDGIPNVQMASVRTPVPVSVEAIRPRVYRCTYVPKVPGAYLLYCKWNDQPLRGSPFKVNVRPSPMARRVKTLGPGLQGGIIGKDLDIHIDPREAGSGELTAKCTDPTGLDLPCNLQSNYDGTVRLKVTPKNVGRHLLEIRYDGEHILGSPYFIDIKASTVHGDVRVYGPGIESGVLPEFQSHFTVDATGAGAGELRVRIMGPRGAFKVKMRKANTKDKKYDCFYDPVETGVYTISVDWSGHPVAGSPFSILLVSSRQELERLEEERSSRYSYHPSHAGTTTLY